MDTQMIPKPSEILREPEHREHWICGSWETTITTRSARDVDSRVRCACATQILYNSAIHRWPTRARSWGVEKVIAEAYGVAQTVVAEGIIINDTLTAEQEEQLGLLSADYEDAEGLEAVAEAGRVYYAYLVSLAPERLEAVAQHYESHGH